MSETGTQQSTRYCGALLWRHRWTVAPSLYRTRSATSSQCKSTCKICDSPLSYLRVPLKRRAAAFSTRCVVCRSRTSVSWPVPSLPCCGSQHELLQKRGQVSSRTHRPVIVEVRTEKKHDAHMLETLLTGLRSTDKVTPSTRT